MGYAVSRCAKPPSWGLPFVAHRQEARSRDHGSILPTSSEEISGDLGAYGASQACIIIWLAVLCGYTYLKLRKSLGPKGAGLSSSNFYGLTRSGEVLIIVVLLLMILAIVFGSSVFQRLDVVRCRAQLWRAFLLDGEVQQEHGQLEWRGLDDAHRLLALIQNGLAARDLDVTIKQFSAAINSTVLHTKQLILNLHDSISFLGASNASWNRHRCLLASRMRTELTSMRDGLEEFLVRHLLRLQSSLSGTLLNPGPLKLSEYAKHVSLDVDSIRRQIDAHDDQLPPDHPLEMMYLLVWWLSMALAAYGAMVIGILSWMLCVVYRIRLKFQQIHVNQEGASGRVVGSAFTIWSCAFPVVTVGLTLAALVLMVASSPRLTQFCADAEAGRLLHPLLRTNNTNGDLSSTKRFLETCLAGNADPRPLTGALQRKRQLLLQDSPLPAEVQARWTPLDPLLLLELVRDANSSRALHWSYFIHVDMTGLLPPYLHVTSADVDGEDLPGLLAYARVLNDGWAASGKNPNVLWTFSSAPLPQVQWQACSSTTTTTSEVGTTALSKATITTNTSNCKGNRSNMTNTSNYTNCTSLTLAPGKTISSTTTPRQWVRCGPPIVRKISAQAPAYVEFWDLSEEMRQLFIVARKKEELRSTAYPPFNNLPELLASHVRRANSGFIQLSTEVAAIQHLLGGPRLEGSLQSSLESIQNLLGGGFDCKSLKTTMAASMDAVCDTSHGAIVMLWSSGVLVMVLSSIVSVVGVLGFIMAEGMLEAKEDGVPTQQTRVEPRRSTLIDPASGRMMF